MNRIAVIGGGIAGALLAWRLTDHRPLVEVQLYTGAPVRRFDASSASGGLVRAFETDLDQCRDAAASLAELRASAQLKQWSGYREIGSFYLVADVSASLGPLLDQVERQVPGSISVLPAAHLVDAGRFRGLPPGALAVVERYAGYLSPDKLRNKILQHIQREGTRITERPVVSVTADGLVACAGMDPAGYDAIVVAAGAWTPALLARSGLPETELRTKAIQYLLVGADQAGCRRAFVDETSELYGRPAAGHRFLMGLPTGHWDVDPGAVPPDLVLGARVLEVAEQRLGIRPVGPQVATFTSVDCYHPEPGLELRPLAGTDRLFSFTGGSGSSAKTVLASSRRAAMALVDALTAAGPNMNAGPDFGAGSTARSLTPESLTAESLTAESLTAETLIAARAPADGMHVPVVAGTG